MTILDGSKTIAFIAVAFMCAAIGGSAMDERVQLAAMRSDVHASLVKTGDGIDAMKASTEKMSAAAVKTMDAATATVKQVGAAASQAKSIVADLKPSVDQLHTDLETADKLEKDARLSLDNVNKGAIDERMYFERDLPPMMAALQDDIVKGGEAMDAAKSFIVDPNLKRIIANSGDMTDSGRKILADGEFETHKLTHPDKKTGFVAGFEASGDIAKHWMPSFF